MRAETKYPLPSLALSVVEGLGEGFTGSSDKIIVQKIEAYTNGHDEGEAIEIDK